jgi:hypothetical protein
VKAFDVVIHELGTKGDLGPERARKVAGEFCAVLALQPDAEHRLAIGGFDTDPRELWDIPEARAFVHRFAGWVALKRPGIRFTDWKLDQPSLSLVAICIGAGWIIGRDPVTGVFIVEIGGRP